MNCKHCHRRKVTRPRGLCYACHQTPAIKVLYPVSSSSRVPLCCRATREETEEDLDRMIAEQLPTMPRN